jgi:uncharacterized damage-inducible protein DinB
MGANPHLSAGVIADCRRLEGLSPMDLLDRLLGHDEWTTRLLLDLCEGLSEGEFDREFSIGHGSLRTTFDHIVHNVEVWTQLMAHQTVVRQADRTIPGMRRRLEKAFGLLREVARDIAERGAWNETWIDYLEDPPRETEYGTSIAHVITHSMHHRAQVIHMLRQLGVSPLPEGDVFSWENAFFPSKE